MSGRKYDSGKPPLFRGLLAYFPDALEAVADVSMYGKEKYDTEYEERNWTLVENALARYQDAALRHLSRQSYRAWDSESGRLHLAHAAWSVLAALQLTIEGGTNTIDPIVELDELTAQEIDAISYGGTCPES